MKPVPESRPAPLLTLYGRGYCHLCDDMAAGLRSLGLEFVEVDIDADAALEDRFGEKVPVLMAGAGVNEVEVCHYFLDSERLREVLTAIH